MIWLAWILLIVFGYLLGSIPTGYLIVKLKSGKDVRKVGSGNVGSTNTIRAAGKMTGGIVFVLDVAKGVIPTLIGLLTVGFELAAFAGLAAVIGHLWPVFLKFSGGKGVASGFGVALVLEPIVALICITIWLIFAIITGYVSLASCIATALVAILAFITPMPLLSVLALFIMAALITWRHRENFQKIKNGTEHKSFRKKEQ
jgi:acyl phosphate:glycerol-3-phosphate acyltransferase